jgi:glycosyltransferase involved in cell wall biosynthesis
LKSQALHAGFGKSQGDVIITMDADLQDSPEENSGLYNMITSQDFDLVKKENDTIRLSLKKPSLFNWRQKNWSRTE